MKRFWEVLFVVVFLIVVAGAVYLDYVAYRERFPNASAWTYLFSGGR